MNLHAISLGLLLFSSFSYASDGETAKSNEAAYQLSFFAPTQSVHCVKVLPTYKQTFDPAFATWTSWNRQKINAGREAAILKLKPGEDIATQETRLSSILDLALNSFPPGAIKASCKQLLDQLTTEGKPK